MLLLVTFVLSILVGSINILYATSDLYITSDDKKISYTVEEALSDEQKAKGLMYREHLDSDKGMIFINSPEKHMYMWMKNTYIPLDMLFADKNGKIVCIVENTTPESEDIIVCPEPVKLTLEINAGEVAKHHINIGDVIHHRLLKEAK